MTNSAKHLLTISALIFAVQSMSVIAKPFTIIGTMDVGNQPLTPKTVHDNDITPDTTRREMRFTSSLPIGSIVVKTKLRKLYFISASGQAIEYAVSVGREGFSWAGRSSISRKAEWPDWRPPPQMIEREAAGGHIIPTLVKGGPSNPLGARALYLGTSDYRIHGTDKPWTIGHASSSGCIRMMNADIIELYRLAKIGAVVVVQ